MVTVVLLAPPCGTPAAWSRVMPLLDDRGVAYIAVQLPSTLPASEHDDATFLRRFLDDRDDQVVLVGHSGGGWLVTEVGAHSAVKHLVYMEAAVPDIGEAVTDFFAGVPRGFGRCVRVSKDTAEFDAEMFAAYLVDQGWTADDASELVAGMRPERRAATVHALTTAAWRTVPSTYIAASGGTFTEEHHDLFRTRTSEFIEVASDHFPHWQRPAEIVDILARVAGQADDGGR